MSSMLIILFTSIAHETNAQTVNCNGNCECPNVSSPQTCILNCYSSNQCKDSTLKCRTGDPCVINCNGDNSCEGNAFIDASGATDVTVSCIGDNACKGNTIINCGTESCAITCVSSTSCVDATVNADTATSLQCTGSCNTFGTIPSPFVLTTDSPTPAIATLNPTQKPTKNPTHNPTYIPTLIPTNSPNLNPTVRPTSYPTVSPTKHPNIQSTISPTSYPTINPTKRLLLTSLLTRHPSISPTKHPRAIPSPSPLAEPIEIHDTETFSTTDTNKDHVDIAYKLAMNPMWYIVIASAVLIISGSIICCCGIFFYYKQKQCDIIQENKKKYEANPAFKVSSISSFEKNETIYKDADAEHDDIASVPQDGDIATVPQKTPEPGSMANIFAGNMRKITIEPDVDANIDDIKNDIEIFNTNDGMDINESGSTDELSSTHSSSSENDGIESKAPPDGNNTIHSAYAQAQAVCSVIDPQMVQQHSFYGNIYGVNMIPYQSQYQYGYISPKVMSPVFIPQERPYSLSQ